MIIKRDLYLKKLINAKDSNLIKVITGIRRCGKSYLLFELYYDYLLSSGIAPDQIIRINLESIKNKPLRDSVSLYNYVEGQIITDDKYYIFIDEIQLVDGFEDLVNGLKVDFNTDVYITGSNSKLLSKDISTSLRGRSIEIKVYPLSFKEYSTAVNLDPPEAFDEYLYFGGLPYLLDDSLNNEFASRNKVDYLNMICDTVVTRDIIDRFNLRNDSLFEAVVNFLCSNIGSYVSANRIANTLKSSGYNKITADTIMKYLEYICDAFLFYKVFRYDIKGKEYLKTLNKYYVSDIGIRNARLNFRQLEITHTIENIVYLELLRRGYCVDIGMNREKEIDFIAKNHLDTFYIQVAYTIADSAKKDQEISAFAKIDDGYKKIVITMDNSPYTILEKGYRLLNLLDFLLIDDALEKA